jgi:uncharacterized membrane protein
MRGGFNHQFRNPVNAMARQKQRTVQCQCCRQEKKLSDVLPAEAVRESIMELIKHQCPDWSADSFICLADLNRFRNQYVEQEVKAEKGELSTLEMEVVQSIKEQELLSRDIDLEYEEKLTLSERWSDKLAAFGGSWEFIGIFFFFILLWIGGNSYIFFRQPLDPYPFIFLNLVLSCIAAIQAPIIMMSQNRQEAKDRLRSRHDYQVNLKAELEIRQLHEKMDHLVTRQWQRLLEIQEIQLELMEEIGNNMHKGRRD